MNVGKILRETAARLPEKRAIIYGEKSITFKKLDRTADQVAGFLSNRGIKKGDRVGIIFPNIPEFVITYFGIIRLGAVGVPLDIRLKGDELNSILKDAEVKAVFIREDKFREIQSDLEHVEGLNTVVISGAKIDKTHHLETILEKGEQQALIETEINEEDEALYLYTSGTTGKPKGVVLTFRNLECFPLAFDQVLKTKEDDVMGFILPVSHISGSIICNQMAFCGSTLVMFDHLRPDRILETIDKHSVTWFHGVPPIFQSLLRVPHRERYSLKSLSFVAIMGTSVTVQLLQEVKQIFPWVKVIQGYGLTETSPLITLLPLEYAETKLGSIGLPVPDIEIKIMDEDSREVSTGEVGEIVVKGPMVMKGYHNNPEATKERIRVGWLYTGDLGKADRDGFFYHLGRKDDMIIVGGLNVFPAEVENVLMKHPNILEAGVVGVPDEDRGQIIKAAVVIKPNKSPDKKEVIAFCQEHLANFKVPKVVEFRNVLPKTSAGKVLRRDLI